jgi:hypothetical protein
MKTKTQKSKMKKNNTKKGIKGGFKKHLKKNNYNKTVKNVHLEKVNCSPKPKGEINDFSCYTNKSLYKLRDLWNARHPDVKITSIST